MPCNLLLNAYEIRGHSNDEMVPEVCMLDWSDVGQTDRHIKFIVTNVQTNRGQVTITLLCYPVTAPYIM